MDFFELEKVGIVIVGLIMAYAEFMQGLKYKRRWIKYGLSFMGLYWAGYYSYSILRTYFDLSFPEHQIFVRSGILLTITLITSNALITLNELKGLKK